MVELTAPTAKDVICDPACGTGGFLVAAGEYLREHHPEILRDPLLKKHFHEQAFHGFDFDNTMLRIGSMNMLLHGVENPDIRYRDSLAQDHAGEEEKYTLVLANPPFAGSLDYETCAKDLQQIVKTKKTELLFLALFLRLLKPGGRAAVIVPDGVLFSSRNRSSTPLSHCPAACSSPTLASPPPFYCLPKPIPAARTTSGFTTWMPMVCRSMTSAPNFCRRKNLAQFLGLR
jgi:type I restriction enzyme M protein